MAFMQGVLPANEEQKRHEFEEKKKPLVREDVNIEEEESDEESEL
jgi:hypothetical protein